MCAVYYARRVHVVTPVKMGSRRRPVACKPGAVVLSSFVVGGGRTEAAAGARPRLRALGRRRSVERRRAAVAVGSER